MNTQFYNLYFEILKSQKNPNLLQEYRKKMKCPNCQSNIIVNSIEIKNEMGQIKGRCSDSSHHSIELNLPIKDQNIWLNLLPKAINICEKCNSTDLLTSEIDFNYTDAIFLFFYEKIIVQICKNCGHKNKKSIFYHFYEVYRRILKEQENEKIEKENLFCSKCNSQVLVQQINLKRNEIQAILLCKENHKTKKNLLPEKKSFWIDSIISSINICSKCWSSNQKILKMHPKLGGDISQKSKEIKIKFQCLECKNKKDLKINYLILDELIDYLLR